MFATVITIKGDWAAKPVVVPKASSLDVSPREVPRMCWVSVHDVPNTVVKVYRYNGLYTGIQCTTDETGVCEFRFGLSNPAGDYVVSDGTHEVSVKLNPSLACYDRVDRFKLIPPEDSVYLGENISIRAVAYDTNNVPLTVSPRYYLGDTSNGYLVDEGSSVLYVPSQLGEQRVYGEYGDAVNFSLIHVLPGRCSNFNVTVSPSIVRVGSTVSLMVRVSDDFDNYKDGVVVSLNYVLPDGSKDLLKNVTDSNGRAWFKVNVGTVPGVLTYEVSESEDGCNSSISGAINIESEIPKHIVIIPNTDEIDVGQTVNYFVKVYDEYGNEVQGYTAQWSSSRPSVLKVNSQGQAEGVFPGQALLRVKVYYDTVETKVYCFMGVCMEFEMPAQYELYADRVITVHNGAPRSLVVTPANTMAVVGSKVRFRAVVYDEFGAQIPNPAIVWSTNVGTIDNSGELTVRTVGLGTGYVRAEYGGLSDEANVEVVADDPANVTFVGSPYSVHNSDALNVQVCVYDQYGNPVSGRKVALSSVLGTFVPDVEFTDQSGCFLSAYLAPSGVEAVDNITAEETITNLQDHANVTIYMNPPTLEGKVVDIFGNPVAGAEVAVDGHVAVSNANGTYSLTVDPGINTAVASKLGYQSDNTTLQFEKDRTYVWDPVLIPYSHVYLYVYDPNTGPVSGAEVNISDVLLGNVVASGTTNANGKLYLMFAPDAINKMYHIEVNAMYYDPASVDMVIQPGDVVNLNFALTGYDSDPPVITFVAPTPSDGDAVKDIINVSVVASDRHLSSVNIYVDGQVVKSCSTSTCNVSVDTSQYSDGSLVVEAEAIDAFGMTSSVSRVYDVDNEPPIVQFVLPTPANSSVISGVVTLNVSGSDATGIVGIELYVNGSLRHTCSSGICEFQWDTSNDVGSSVNVTAVAYSRLNSAYTYHNYTVNPTYYVSRVEVVAVPGTLELGDNSTIYVRVYDNHGQPMANEQVNVVPSDGNVDPHFNNTDSNGVAVFVYTPINYGDFTVYASAGGVTNSTVVHVIDLSGDGTIKGEVSDAQGNSIAGAEVALYQNGAKLFSTHTNLSGEYNMTVSAGYYEVRVSASGYATTSESNVLIETGRVVVKDYTLLKLSRLYGLVSNETGDPIENARLDAYRNGVLIDTVYSDANGQYEFYLESGVYYVEITHGDYLDASYTVYLPSESSVEKNVVMYR